MRSPAYSLLRTASGADGRAGEDSEAGGGGFGVGSGPGVALAVVGAPDLVAVGLHGQADGHGDHGKLLGCGGVDVGNSVPCPGPPRRLGVWRAPASTACTTCSVPEEATAMAAGDLTPEREEQLIADLLREREPGVTQFRLG